MRRKLLSLSDSDRAELEAVADYPARSAKRARIVLLAAEGCSGTEIAEVVGVSEPTVVQWRKRYEQFGLPGLEDLPRAGRPLL